MRDEATVKDLVAVNPAAAAVFDEVGIEFCCEGDEPISAACAHAGLSVADVMGRIEDLAARGRMAERAPEAMDWTETSMAELTGYIVNHHHAYARQALAQMRHLLPAADAAYGDKHPELKRLRQVFTLFEVVLAEHMDEEEAALFPSLVRLEAWRAGGATQTSSSWTERVRALLPLMRRDHNTAANLMRTLRQESHRFRPPAYSGVLIEQVYEMLRAFEHDLHWHVHLENNVLFPRALDLIGAGFRERIQ